MRSLASAVARAFDALPTRWLVVGGLTVRQLATLLKQRVLAGLTELTVQLAVSADEANEAARLLANCRHLRNLRGLALAFPAGDAGFEALAGAHWGELEWFSPDCNDLGEVGVRALAGAAWFRRLRELTLEGGLWSDAFAALASLPALRRLLALDLSKNSLSPESWRAFAQSDSFPALAQLRLGGGNLCGGRAEALAGAGGFELRVLEAGSCGAEPGAGEAVAAAPWAGSLRVLDLSSNRLGPRDAKAVAAGPFGALRHLDLSDNGTGPTGLSALAANPALRGLRTLKLAGRAGGAPKLTPAHLERFLAKLDAPELRHLDLGGLPLGPKAARRLAEPKFASLTRLELNDCRLTGPSVKALLESPALNNLIQLDLSDNGLTSGPELLTDRAVLPRLASCSLGGNAIPTAVARRLRRRPGVRV
jgi:hypothetical protein